MTAEPSPYLTVSEAAKLARCNPRTIRRAVASGRLEAFRPAHRVLLREAAVRAWVEAKAATPPQRPTRLRRRPSTAGSVAALREIETNLTR